MIYHFKMFVLILLPVVVPMDEFITQYPFHPDKKKPYRVLEQVQIGGVYISRLTMQPGAVTGNLYHKETNSLVFVTQGDVETTFVQIETHEQQDTRLGPASGIIHVPPFVAMAQHNNNDSVAVVILFSDKPLRSNDDYPFAVSPRFSREAASSPQATFAPETSCVTQYQFTTDMTKPGRVLKTVKVGDVFISHLTVEPGVVTGNLYHKKTKVMLFVSKGTVRFKFVHVLTKEERELTLHPESGIIHVPPNIAIADKNISKEEATIIYFSDLPFRQDDDYSYPMYA